MGFREYHGPIVAIDTAEALDERYAASRSHWGDAHCVHMCLMANLSTVKDAQVSASSQSVYGNPGFGVIRLEEWYENPTHPT